MFILQARCPAISITALAVDEGCFIIGQTKKDEIKTF